MRACAPQNAFCFVYQCGPGCGLISKAGAFVPSVVWSSYNSSKGDFVGGFLISIEKVLPFVWMYCVSRNALHRLGEFFGFHLTFMIFRMSRLWKCHFYDWEMQIRLMELCGWNRASHLV